MLASFRKTFTPAPAFDGHQCVIQLNSVDELTLSQPTLKEANSGKAKWQHCDGKGDDFVPNGREQTSDRWRRGLLPVQVHSLLYARAANALTD